MNAIRHGIWTTIARGGYAFASRVPVVVIKETSRRYRIAAISHTRGLVTLFVPKSAVALDCALHSDEREIIGDIIGRLSEVTVSWSPRRLV